MITLKNITEVYAGKIIFKNFSLIIPKGLSFIDSESNEKKDCLIDIILGHKKPDEGNVFFNNVVIPFSKYQELLTYRQNLGVFTGKSIVLLNNLNAYENIIFFGEYLYKRSQKELYDKAIHYAGQFKIDNVLEKLPYEMTFDERQKTYFIMMLFKSPKVFIIDYDFGKLNLSTDLISGIIKKEQELGVNFILFGNRELRNAFDRKSEINI